MEVVNLDDVHSRAPALTEDFARNVGSASKVCLEENGHSSNISMQVTGSTTSAVDLSWKTLSDQERRTHNDLQDATEEGAVAIALCVVSIFSSKSVVERSWKGTGFDYWLGEKNDQLFQKTDRLEVSGILSGDKSTIDQRMRRKEKQIERGAQRDPQLSDLGAYIVVVEFSRPESRMEHE